MPGIAFVVPQPVTIKIVVCTERIGRLPDGKRQVLKLHKQQRHELPPFTAQRSSRLTANPASTLPHPLCDILLKFSVITFTQFKSSACTHNNLSVIGQIIRYILIAYQRSFNLAAVDQGECTAQTFCRYSINGNYQRQQNRTREKTLQYMHKLLL